MTTECFVCEGALPPFIAGKKGKDLDFEAGIFLVDKPVGPSSFKMVQQVRRALRIKKVGHAGTLDPFASGLLVICAGRPATKIISRLMDGEKEYEAVLKLGIATDTYDLEGKIISEQPVGNVDQKMVDSCLAGFVGEQLQMAPQYSALKHEGKPLYFYARQGIEISKPLRRIVIKEIEYRGLENDLLTIRVVCSKGTYIRTLADDIGKELGCGAHLVALRRLRSGPFFVQKAIDGAGLADKERGRELLLRHVLSVEDVLNCLAT